MNPFCLKIKSERQGLKYAKILKDNGFKWWSEDRYGKYKKGYLFIGEFDEFYFSEYLDDAIEFKSFREFFGHALNVKKYNRIFKITKF